MAIGGASKIKTDPKHKGLKEFQAEGTSDARQVKQTVFTSTPSLPLPPPDVREFQSHSRTVLLPPTYCDESFQELLPSPDLPFLPSTRDDIIICRVSDTCAHILSPHLSLSFSLFPTKDYLLGSDKVILPTISLIFQKREQRPKFFQNPLPQIHTCWRNPGSLVSRSPSLSQPAALPS